MGRARILVVDTHTELFEGLQELANKENLLLHQHKPGIDTNLVVTQLNPQLVIIGHDLITKCQLDLCRQIRHLVSVPIIITSAKKEVLEILLDAGANDFVTTPYEHQEVMLRIKAHLGLYRQESMTHPYSIQYKDLSIDLIQQIVHHKGVEIELSSQEFKLLTYLAHQPTRISNSEQLYEQLWGSGSHKDARTVLVHISNIRRKLATDSEQPPYIQTIRGIGYKFHEYYM